MMRKFKLENCLTAALLISSSLTGCAIKPTSPTEPDFCATAQPIYVSKDDVFSDVTAREILKHNLTGRKLCGW